MRRGTLSGIVRTGATFADAAAEWLRYVEHDRRRKPSTVAGYRAIVRSQLMPAFASMPLESITTPVVEAWIVSVDRSASTRTKGARLAPRDLPACEEGLGAAPVTEVEKPPMARSGDIEVFSPEEVWALVRVAAGEQDAVLFLTAAFIGLRMGELLGLHWRDVDFAGSVIRVRVSYDAGALTTPKSGRSERCRWRRTSQRRLGSLSAARFGSATMTWCSGGRLAATWMGRRCGGGTRPRSPRRDFAR